MEGSVGVTVKLVVRFTAITFALFALVNVTKIVNMASSNAKKRVQWTGGEIEKLVQISSQRCLAVLDKRERNAKVFKKWQLNCSYQGKR